MELNEVYRPPKETFECLLEIEEACGLIHGNLSEFNVIVGPDGPVIIDLPQVVNAAGNNGAFAMLQRDVNNIRNTLGRLAPELLETEFARRRWLKPTSPAAECDTPRVRICGRRTAPHMFRDGFCGFH